MPLAGALEPRDTPMDHDSATGTPAGLPDDSVLIRKVLHENPRTFWWEYPERIRGWDSSVGWAPQHPEVLLLHAESNRHLHGNALRRARGHSE